MSKKLIFVYNAESGFFNSVADSFHKTFSPETYSCNLCKLTYGNLNMKKQWKDFVNDLNLEVVFLHKDEFLKKYPKNSEKLPVLFIEENKILRVLVSSEEINFVNDLDGLINIIKAQHL